ncbi:aminoglycoside 6'-N-acetyltransferase [Naumannella cuiyingiana]|uniref:Aminoglycoside 6'-N-acetyltransferase n=1 Tax=Naumannella cuiyingiana TaxID=1347891 RepID=A0A7Z0D9B6_9ACTN|nr:aminoglycoside 6'-N-acetyltransferase [Naumannella cuiyingiana]
MATELHTARLRLRLHRLSDTDALLAYYGEPGVARYLLEGPWTVRTAPKKVAQRVERTGFADDGTALALVAEADGTVVGDIALWLTDDTRRKAEIGWAFNPRFAGRGYATEAARAVLDHAFDDLGLLRVVAQMDARNAASARLCERLGMTREAHLRHDWFAKGEWTDTFVYGLLATDRG